MLLSFIAFYLIAGLFLGALFIYPSWRNERVNVIGVSLSGVRDVLTPDAIPRHAAQRLVKQRTSHGFRAVYYIEKA